METREPLNESFRAGFEQERNYLLGEINAFTEGGNSRDLNGKYATFVSRLNRLARQYVMETSSVSEFMMFANELNDTEEGSRLWEKANKNMVPEPYTTEDIEALRNLVGQVSSKFEELFLK